MWLVKCSQVPLLQWQGRFLKQALVRLLAGAFHLRFSTSWTHLLVSASVFIILLDNFRIKHWKICLPSTFQALLAFEIWGACLLLILHIISVLIWTAYTFATITLLQIVYVFYAYVLVKFIYSNLYPQLFFRFNFLDLLMSNLDIFDFAELYYETF